MMRALAAALIVTALYLAIQHGLDSMRENARCERVYRMACD